MRTKYRLVDIIHSLNENVIDNHTIETLNRCLIHLLNSHLNISQVLVRDLNRVLETHSIQTHVGELAREVKAYFILDGKFNKCIIT
jgi:hypothetical protein